MRAEPRTITPLLFLLIGAIATGAFLTAFPIPVARASTINISIKNFAFNPSSVTIAVGDTVTWTNMDSVPHTVTADGGAFNSGSLSFGQSFSFTFMSAGSLPYHCAIHPYMTGTVGVGASSSSTTSSVTTTSSTATSTLTTSTSSSQTSSTSITSSSISTSTTTTPTKTTTSVVYTKPTVPETTSSSATSSSGSVPEFPLQGALVAALTLAVVASYLLIRLGRKGNPTPSHLR